MLKFSKDDLVAVEHKPEVDVFVRSYDKTAGFEELEKI